MDRAAAGDLYRAELNHRRGGGSAGTVVVVVGIVLVVGGSVLDTTGSFETSGRADGGAAWDGDAPARNTSAPPDPTNTATSMTSSVRTSGRATLIRLTRITRITSADLLCRTTASAHHSPPRQVLLHSGTARSSGRDERTRLWVLSHKTVLLAD